jgi:MoxR-like ATPase
MLGNPMNIPPISIAAAKAALIEQYADTTLRKRASMLWGTRGVGKSSVVRQVAAHFSVPLVDLRLTTIEPVDIRGAIYADDAQGKTVWFPPEFIPPPDQPAGILFLDELNMAPPAIQGIAQQLVLDRKVGSYTLPEGWHVWAAGNRSEDGASVFSMPSALQNRFIHVTVEPHFESFRSWALQNGIDEKIVAFCK